MTVAIQGSGFKSGATVRLMEGSQVVLTGQNTAVGSRTRLRTTFDLKDQPAKALRLEVVNPDGASASAPTLFTIENGGQAQVWVDIIGRDTIRVGREQTFNIVYGNRGNIDAVGVPLWVAGIPKDATVKLGFEVTAPPLLNPQKTINWGRVPKVIETDREKALPLFIPRVSPGASKTLRISLTIPQARDFQLRAWTNPPSFGSPLLPAVFECGSAIVAVILGAIDLVPAGGCGVEVTRLIRDLYNQTIALAASLADTTTTGNDVVFSLADMFASIVWTAGECIIDEASFFDELILAIPKGLKLGLDFNIAIDKCQRAAQRIGEKVSEVRAVASYDPNDKIGAGGIHEMRYLSGEEPLRYTILFENVATATAPAQEVVITDQLDAANLDLDTFSLGPIVFGSRQLTPPSGSKQFTTGVDLRPAKNLIVKIAAGLDTNTGLLTWRFTSIDPATGQLPEDPLAGFLPPNNTPPEGDGSVIFTIKPKNGLPSGTQIRNRASIVFDANSPIETPGWFNTLDNTKPSSRMAPVAAAQCAEVEAQWSGTDDHSGVKEYTIFVSDNGGPFTPWLSQTTQTRAVFKVTSGHTYAFYSLARDNAGNVEDPPATPDTSFTASSPALSPATQSFPAPGGRNSVNVAASSECGWMARSDAAWIAIRSVTSGPVNCPQVAGFFCGRGNGQVDYAVTANSGPSPRVGTMTIAGQVFTVRQESAAASPAIGFSSVPQYCSFDDLKGRAWNVNPTAYKVAVYIRVSGWWWPKPTFGNPLTPLQPDGSWTCDITTDGIDETASRIVAYLLPNSCNLPPPSSGPTVPAAIEQCAVAKVEATRAPVPPLMISRPASAITPTSATLNGEAHARCSVTDTWFDWGLSDNLASFNSTPARMIGLSKDNIAFSETLIGLTPGTTYYYRLAGSNVAGRTRGAILSFTTPTIAAPSPEQEPNETTAQANPISLPGRRTGVASVGDATAVQIIYTNGDRDGIEDLFAITLSQSARLDLTMNFSNAAADLDLFLLRIVGNSVSVLGASNSGTATTERIVTNNALAPGVYYVAVSAWRGSSAYTLAAAQAGSIFAPQLTPAGDALQINIKQPSPKQ